MVDTLGTGTTTNTDTTADMVDTLGTGTTVYPDQDTDTASVTTAPDQDTDTSPVSTVSDTSTAFPDVDLSTTTDGTLGDGSAADTSGTGGGTGGIPDGAGTGGDVGTGGGCPDPTTPILTSPTSSVPAGSLVVGDYIYTMHETTKEFGNFKVVMADIWQQPKLHFHFADNTEIIVSESHRFLLADDTWEKSIKVSVGTLLKGIDGNKEVTSITSVGSGPVVKFEIESAHTYVSAGIISHNAKTDIDDVEAT